MDKTCFTPYNFKCISSRYHGTIYHGGGSKGHRKSVAKLKR